MQQKASAAVQFESEGHLLAEFFFAQGRSVFSILTFYWLDKAHPHYEDDLFSQSQQI